MVTQDSSVRMSDDPTAMVPAGSASAVQHAHRTVCAARISRRQYSAGGHSSGRSLTVHSRRHADRSRYQSGVRELEPHLRTRSLVTCVLITVAVGLLFLVVSEIFDWVSNPELVWFGLFLIFFGGAVWLNAITFDSLRAAQGATAPGAASRTSDITLSRSATA